MSLPGNGIFVVQGEMAMLVTAMRRSTRWGSHSFPNEEYDVLMRTFQDLKTILNQVEDLRLLDPPTYLSPFLEVIRSKETTGPVTSLALSAIHKFLSYGLIDPTHPSVPATVEDIADAVTHARFVGTDHSSDGVVLMKILQVLRTLMLSPEGAMLTDESVCEIMLSCFRICFETRLTELLRRNAEQCLRDMTQLIFMRLPQFPPEDAGAHLSTLSLSLKKRDKSTKKKSMSTAHSTNSLDRKSSLTDRATSPTVDNVETDSKVDATHSLNQDKNLMNEAEITIEPVEQQVKSPGKKHARHSSMDLAHGNPSISQLLEKCVSSTDTLDSQHVQHDAHNSQLPEETKDDVPQAEEEEVKDETQKEVEEKLEEYVNHRGIRFTPQEETPNLQPYGLVCVRELFRFVISLCNPLEGQNTSAMVQLGLALAGTALEVAGDQLPRYPALLHLVRDPLCRNLLSLLDTERISIFALDLQVSFLLFEALRFHLKFQMEAFFKKIIEIISADTSKSIYELKEIHHLALESLAQMFRIPGFCAELYLNYDCDIYCMNVFEEITKLLSKNVVSSTAYNIHSLSLEALMTIIEAIEMGTSQKMEKSEIEIVEEEKGVEVLGRGGQVSLELGGMDDVSVVSDHVTHDISQYVTSARTARHKPTGKLPTEPELDNIKNMKKWVTQGTELFNQKPERGVEFLQEHGVLATPLDPHQVALFLRENPDLDKKMIGEYICKRSSRGEEGTGAGEGVSGGVSVLSAFADSFDYRGQRIDIALRQYLETFRLPGEAPLIFLVMEKFAERWHTTNGSPFANTDAAFRLAYAIIMLNMDQHNHNAKKLNVPMTAEDFVRNLRGCNGTGDFDQPMLEAIFNAIKNEEMVMPAERVGLVREAYLWRVLQRRARGSAAVYRAPPLPHHHSRLLPLLCPSAISALSAAYERAPQPSAEEVGGAGAGSGRGECVALAALGGLERVAALVARLQPDTVPLDTLLLTLCKFSGLLTPPHAGYIAIGVSLGQSMKAQLALRRACVVAARHADCVRDAWRHLLEILQTLYIGRLLPKCLVEAEDYLAPGGTVSLIRDTARGSDAGLLSSIYSYIALGETGMRAPTPHEKALIDVATDCVVKCNFPGLLITETKFLQLESLQELVRAMVTVGTPPDAESLQLNPHLEDITIFFLEILGKTLIQNRDRLSSVWGEAGAHVERVVWWASARGPQPLTRALTALLRTAARLMRCELCAPPVLHHLTLLFHLPYKLFYQQADVISCGLYELVKTSAQNVHSGEEWGVLLALLAAAGAGAWPQTTRSRPDGDRWPPAAGSSSRSEASDEETEKRPTSVSSESELSHSPHTQGWILKEASADGTTSAESGVAGGLWNAEIEGVVLRAHRPSALARCAEALALVVRDVAHVTPHNCRAAVRAVRLLARATLHPHGTKGPRGGEGGEARRGRGRRKGGDSSDEELDTLDQYHMVSIQLLDLMHTLHSRTAQIFKWWREEADQGHGGEDYDLWEVAWKPLLQGIAEFCTDRRRQVANSAIAYLQRALLAPALGALGGAGWAACFEHVLLPLLAAPPRRPDAAARADTVMCKVFLQHLQALSARPGFGALWARVLGVQRALLATPHEPLQEAALESLKNMLLVMHSVRIFNTGDNYNELWYLTWQIISEFLPTLKDELFPEVNDNTRPAANLPSHMQPPLPPTLPTLVPVPAPTPSLPPTDTPTHASRPLNVQTSHAQSPNILVASMAHSPVNLIQTPPMATPSLVAPTPINMSGSAPTAVGAGPTAVSAVPPAAPAVGSAAPPAVSNAAPPLAPLGGLVPIRNPLYDQTGLTSSVLLQPLNEMISTPIGISIQTQPPVLCPRSAETAHPQPIANQNEPYAGVIESTITDTNVTNAITETQQSDLYAEYLSNPYNEAKELTISDYDPEENRYLPDSKDQNVLQPEPYNTAPATAPAPPHKSFSANTTPSHSGNLAQFLSTENVRKESSSIFNFSNYFGSGNDLTNPGSELFDTLTAAQEG
ncbi:PREDICTED: Golgi-specific brefeldin A-resistance guanine nucleotide exchange factor 1 isoform X2 [Papilio xuthus]|uniref:Golgi-specific brefeldin A-resistance guanine nucleotide exchange factor 1 isoform X2 n=1 Tax=Papilio xuthus TaxID=66420 RepID=A0AAJ6Z6U5_PAPXU|nr:PREDICTED: Golgi-specific brefeldin A-resistance guanine nucleotide exchange factor 1 isoform X2 [Papilio xuthus]